MGSLTIEVAGAMLFLSALGGSLGTGLLAIRLYLQFQARERELERKIQLLEERNDALLELMVRERLISVDAAQRVKKSTGPLSVNVGHDLTVGGDFTGHDKGG